MQLSNIVGRLKRRGHILLAKELEGIKVHARILSPKTLDSFIKKNFKGFYKTRFLHGECGVFALGLYDFLKERGLTAGIYLLGYSTKNKSKKVKTVRVKKVAPSHFAHVLVSYKGKYFDVNGIQNDLEALAEKYSDFDIGSNSLIRVKRNVLVRNMGELKSLRELDEKALKYVKDKLGKF